MLLEAEWAVGFFDACYVGLQAELSYQGTKKSVTKIYLLLCGYN